MKRRTNQFLAVLHALAIMVSLTAAPASAAQWSRRIEAETGAMTGTVHTERIVGGSGKIVSFIDNSPANSLEIQVTPQGGSDYVMKLRYRSGEIRNLM